MILVEQKTGGFKISFRSRCHVEANKLAARFNGGGHKAAAGGFIDEPYEPALKKVLAAAAEMLLAAPTN
ncbi:MAG: DHHA1 domain-containing protein [Pirellulales bacterium]